MFFWAYIRHRGGCKSVRFRNSEEISNFKRFYLRSETVSEEKSQGKNDFFGALRAATTAGRRKNKRKSFLILVSSDRKPQKGVFLAKLRYKQGARSARKIFGVFFMRAKRACYQRVEKRFKKCALWGRKSRRKSVHFGEKKHWFEHGNFKFIKTP